MSKFLVTGGMGLIGHNVVQRLEAKEHEVVIVDIMTNYGIIPQAELEYLLDERRKKIKTLDIYRIDISDAEAFDRVVANHKPDVIIHMASFPRQTFARVPKSTVWSVWCTYPAVWSTATLKIKC